MDRPLRILLFENSKADVQIIEHLLKRQGIKFTSRIVDTRNQLKQVLEDFLPDVLLSGHSLPRLDAMEAVKLFQDYRKKKQIPAAFILVSETVSEEFAVELLQKGADDFILKDRLKRLPWALLNALEKSQLLEERLKAEEEKLHLLDILQKSLHEVFIFNPDTYLFEYVNQEGLRNLGYNPEEIARLTSLDVLKDLDQSTFEGLLARVEKSRKGRIFETRSFRKDESSYPVQVHLQLIEQGQRKTFLANALDITESRKEERQKKLASFIQKTFNETGSLKAGLRIVLKELCECEELPAAEFWAKNFGETEMRRYAVYDEEDKPVGKAGPFLVEKAMGKGRSVFVEHLQESQLNSFGNRYQSAMAYTVTLEKEILAVIIVYSKERVSDKDSFFQLRKNVQDQLANNIKRKKTEEELSKIFELSPDILAIVGIDGYVKKINPSVERVLGHSVQKILSTPLENFLHPEDQHTLLQWKRSLQENERVTYYQNRYRTACGQYKWFAWSSTPFLDEGLAFVVGKDITEQKQQLKAIEKQNERLTEIAWEQSHVVRGPLSRMMSCIQHLEESDEYSDILLESIKSSAYELDKVIKSIVNKAEFIKND